MKLLSVARLDKGAKGRALEVDEPLADDGLVLAVAALNVHHDRQRHAAAASRPRPRRPPVACLFARRGGRGAGRPRLPRERLPAAGRDVRRRR